MLSPIGEDQVMFSPIRSGDVFFVQRKPSKVFFVCMKSGEVLSVQRRSGQVFSVQKIPTEGLLHKELRKSSLYRSRSAGPFLLENIQKFLLGQKTSRSSSLCKRLFYIEVIQLVLFVYKTFNRSSSYRTHSEDHLRKDGVQQVLFLRKTFRMSSSYRRTSEGLSPIKKIFLQKIFKKPFSHRSHSESPLVQ